MAALRDRAAYFQLPTSNRTRSTSVLDRQSEMLDAFEILTTSGVVLWSRTYAPVNPSVVNDFITDVFIEEKSAVAGSKNGGSAASNPPYKHDQHSLRWTFVKELGIIFVVGVLHLGDKMSHRMYGIQGADYPGRRLSIVLYYIFHGLTNLSTISGPFSSAYTANNLRGLIPRLSNASILTSILTSSCRSLSRRVLGLMRAYPRLRHTPQMKKSSLLFHHQRENLSRRLLLSQSPKTIRALPLPAQAT